MPPAATKPVFIAYLAVSVDGYIADERGGVKWLERFNDSSLGFDKFYKTIDTVVVGRTTYEQAVSWGAVDTERRTIVLTENHLTSPSPNVEGFKGDVKQLAKRLGKEGAKRVWLMGGGESIRLFQEAGLVDRWELFVVPVLLGKGIPLFPESTGKVRELTLVACKPGKGGVVELQYEKAARASAASTKK